MSTRTRREIISDWFRTVKIVTFTTLAVLLIAWLSMGTLAMMKVDRLEKEVEYYQQKEEKANSKKTIEVNGQTYVLVEDV